MWEVNIAWKLYIMHGKKLLSVLDMYIRLLEAAQTRLLACYVLFLEPSAFQPLLSSSVLVQGKATGILSWQPKQRGSL